MLTSEKTDQIIPAFVTAQAAMEGAKKDSKNPHFESKYADLESVMQACRAALKENGLAVFQTANDEGTALATRIYHTSGQWLESTTPLIVGKKDMQGFGSAVTYARRYALMAALGIAPEDDDGNAAAANPPTQNQTPEPAAAKPPEDPAARARAEKYVTAQLAMLPTIKSRDEFDGWREQADQQFIGLKNYFPDLYEKLVEASEHTQATLSRSVAAE